MYSILTADEIERMKNNEQLVFIRGVRPFCTEKYTYENHPNYKYTAGSGRKESIALDMERFNIAVDYEAMERTYVYALGDEKHVEPVELEQYKGVKLPMLTHLSKDDCPEVSEIATEQLNLIEEYYKPEKKKEQPEQEQKAKKKERKHFFERKQGQER